MEVDRDKVTELCELIHDCIVNRDIVLPEEFDSLFDYFFSELQK